MSKTMKVGNLALKCKQMNVIAIFTGIQQEDLFIVWYLIRRGKRKI